MTDEKPGNTEGRGDGLTAYRAALIQADREGQTAYDRTLLSMSAGALGVTFLFVERFIAGRTPELIWLLVSSWALWTLSILAVLWSHYLSSGAIRAYIEAVDKGNIRQYSQKNRYSRSIKGLNLAGFILFTAGTGLAVIFAAANLR